METDLMQLGRYDIEEQLAIGGMGEVYLARSPSGMQVVVKHLASGSSQTSWSTCSSNWKPYNGRPSLGHGDFNLPGTTGCVLLRAHALSRLICFLVSGSSGGCGIDSNGSCSLRYNYFADLHFRRLQPVSFEFKVC